jgi:hypothetical protein
MYNETHIVERFIKKYGRKPTKLEYSDEYRRTHQSEIKERDRKYQETHREEIRERSHRYQIKRKEEVRLLRERLIVEEKERTQSHTRLPAPGSPPPHTRLPASG